LLNVRSDTKAIELLRRRQMEEWSDGQRVPSVPIQNIHKCAAVHA